MLLMWRLVGYNICFRYKPQPFAYSIAWKPVSSPINLIAQHCL